MKARICIAIIVLIILTTFNHDLWAQKKAKNPYPPYQVKSFILRRIPKHFNWPPGSKVNDLNSPFVLSVIGDNPFEKWLDALFSRKTIKNKKVKIRYIKKIEEIPGTNLLFISKTSRKELNRILEYTSDKPILTVSDTEGYGNRGVNVNILEVTEKGKALQMLEVNEASTRRAGLAIKQTMYKGNVEVIQAYDPGREKAEALIRLAKEARWPASAMAPPDSPFRIVILGANPFGTTLYRLAKKNKIHNKEVDLNYKTSVQTVGSAHLVFISSSKSNNIPGIISTLKNKPVLLVSDTKGFAEQGVHVNFYIDVNVKTEINVAALMGSGVSINRDYISMSRRVTSQ